MDPERFERTVAHGIADAAAMEEQAMPPCWSPLDRSAISPSD
jgi:hypothetical protein